MNGTGRMSKLLAVREEVLVMDVVATDGKSIQRWAILFPTREEALGAVGKAFESELTLPSPLAGAMGVGVVVSMDGKCSRRSPGVPALVMPTSEWTSTDEIVSMARTKLAAYL